jgi:filamentous hemagglutinin family protein
MSKHPRSKKPSFQLKPACAAVLLAFSVHQAGANPIGGSVVNGNASFNTTGNTLTVTNTPGTIINWQGFSINSNEITHFAQQSASSAVLNRVITSNPSSILGTLSSNGRVFLVNPSGIVFGQGSTVDVAGMVATSLNLSDADFLAGRGNFALTPGAQAVSNAGNITAQSGGEIYLIAPNVDNTGIITAPNGDILLVAGNSVELVNNLDPNLRVNITAPAGDATNVGQLVASAGSLGLFGTVVKNTGTVSADSATMQGGKIVFRSSQRTAAGGTISAQGVGGGEIKILSDMQSGTVNVSGTLDASAPVPSPNGGGLGWGSTLGGNGGFIETSAAHVQVAGTARITTAAPFSKAGIWLIDPADYTIAATDPLNGSSYMSNTTLATSLVSSNVTIQTLATGTGNGDIFVNDAVSWSSANSLTLNAIRDVNINAAISNTGGGNLIVRADLNGTGTGTIIFAPAGAGPGGSVTLSGGGRADLYYNPFSYTDTASKSDALTNPYSTNITGAYTAWMLVNDVGLETGGTLGLQAMATNLTGNYALGKNIDATITSAWNVGAGFVPVGTISFPTTNFTGMFDGQGRTIDGLFINSSGDGGLFGFTKGSTIKNVTLSNVNITASGYAGGLVGWHQGVLSNSQVLSGAVTGSSGAGGLVGMNYNGSNVSNSSAGATVSGASYVGGLIGASQQSTLTNVSATGNVTGTNWGAGGLVGSMDGDLSPHSLTNGTASGNVNGVRYVGGLVGWNGYWSTITNGIASGDVTSTLTDAGGLVGMNAYIISGSQATGNVSGVTNVGGLVGNNYYDNNPSFFYTYGSVSNSYANTGTVTGTTNVGGLVGYNYLYDTISTSNAGGAVSGLSNVGGLVGINDRGSISTSFATGTVTHSNANSVSIGGLVGDNSGIITDSYVTTANVTGYMYVGGLVGFNHAYSGCCYANSITNSYVSGGSVTGAVSTGGLVGNNAGTVTNSHYNINAVSINGSNIVTVGGLYNDQLNVNRSGQYDAWLLNNGLTLNIADYATLSGSAGNYSISNAQGLKDMLGFADTLNTFTLTAAIDMSALPGFYVPILEASFDGAGFAISNFSLNRPDTSNLGFFGQINGASNVSNILLVNATVNGKDNVGALAGLNQGTINNSSVNITTSVNPTISGGTNVGGLVGSNAGKINTSSFSANSGGIASVTGVTNVGGLVGLHQDLVSVSNIHDSGVYANTGGFVNVSGVTNVGGLGGSLNGGLDFCYVSNATITASGANIGGLAGQIVLPPFYSYFNVDGVTTNGANNVTRGGLYSGQYNTWLANGRNIPLFIGNYSSTLSLQQDGSYGISDLQGMKDMLAFSDISTYSFSLTGSVVLTQGFYVPLLAGSFNGNNFSLANLSIKLPNSDMGLFGNINFNSSVVSNIALVNASVSGANNVGSLAGTNYGTIDSVVVTGTIVVTGTGDNVGGLVGHNFGNINNSSVSGVAPDGSNVAVSGGAGYVGGLVGYNDFGNISNSSVSNATVSGSFYVGGLVGYNWGAGSFYFSNSSSSYGTSGLISNSFVSNGSVTGTSGNIGGLIGYNSGGAITGSHAIAPNVNGGASNAVGGLVGGNKGNASSSSSAYFSGGIISNSFVSGGTVTSTGNDVGGLVGNNYGAFVNLSYVDSVAVSGNLNVGGLVGNDSGEGGCCMPTVGAVWNSYAVNTQVTGGSNVGGLLGYIGLAPTMTGSGGPSRYDNVFNSYVSGGTVTSNGNSSASAIGGLVGNNNIGNISGSYVTSGTVVNGGNARNVGGLVGFNQFNSTGLSSSAAFNYGIISNSYVSGGIVSAANSNVGGLVGRNDGSVTNSFVSGTSVSGAWDVAGLVGQNGGIINNSYVNSSSIIATSASSASAGGLVGYNKGSISNSYVSGGSVSAPPTAWSAGGVVGFNDSSVGGTVSGTFWDTALATASLTKGIGYDNTILGATDAGAAGLDSVGMMTMANFTAALWDIADTGGTGTVWRIYEGHTTPLLSIFLTQTTLTVNDDVKTYDGNAYSGGKGYTVSAGVAVNGGTVLGNYGGNSQGATNAGTYVIDSTGFYSDQLGFDITSYTDGTLTIGTAAVTLLDITANKASKTYGSTLTFNGTEFVPVGLVGGDFISRLTLTSAGAVNSANVGNYSIDVTPGSEVFGQGLAGNYSITYQPGTLTVNPATLTYTATAASRTYGDANPAFSGTVTGFVLNDNLANATTGTAAFSTPAPLNSNVGSYAINGSGLTAINGNYLFTQATRNATAYSILQRGISIVANAVSKMYGSPDALTFNVVGSLAAWDTNATAFTGVLSRTAGENVVGSPYAITQGTLNANSNYSITGFTSNNLVVTPAPLTVAGIPATKVLGTIDPLLKYTVAGLKYSDTADAVLAGALARDVGETIGSHTVNNGTLALVSSNYSYNPTTDFTPCNFTILAPTVVQEITQAILKVGTPKTETAATTEEKDEKLAEAAIVTEVTKAEGIISGTEGQMPVCR